MKGLFQVFGDYFILFFLACQQVELTHNLEVDSIFISEEKSTVQTGTMAVKCKMTELDLLCLLSRLGQQNC